MTPGNHRIRIPADTHRRLKVAAAARGVSIATLAVRAVEEYLERIKDGR